MKNNECCQNGSDAKGDEHEKACHCNKHSDVKNIDLNHSCCTGSKPKFIKTSTRLVVSAIALFVGFLIAYLNVDFPFFPYSDPSWIAVLLCSGGIFSSAYKSIYYDKKITTAMLVSLAMIASFGLQIMDLCGFGASGGHAESYIFVVGEIAFLMTLGSWLEEKTLAKTAEGLGKLSNLMPKTARVRRGETLMEIPANEIHVGDIVCVNPDEMIAADGVIIKGETSVDQSNMTGESIPADKKVGDKILCGTFNTSAYIEIRASKAGENTLLSKLIDLVEEAEGRRAPISRIANKWASLLVPLALATSVIVFIIAYFFLNAGMSEAIVRGVTVLVVFCPCAFVLATPTAISAGIGNAARNGILIKSGEALEALSKISDVFFDKTGTLTNGNIRVEKFECIKGDESTLLKMSAAIEKNSSHPLAKAIVQYAESRLNKNEIPTACDVKSQTGSGVRGLVLGKIVEIKKSSSKNSSFTTSEIFVDSTLCAKIEFADTLRQSAKEAVSQLKADSCEVAILSGDNENAARKVGVQLGIKNVYANLLPQQKLELIRKFQSKQKHICMVGDGVNDAPSLAAADVSIAIADLKNDIAINTAKITLLNPNLEKIPAMFEFSKSVIGTIAANIVLSLSISLAAVVLSVFGTITPAIGALIHNASSVGVVLNSARLLKSKKLANKKV